MKLVTFTRGPVPEVGVLDGDDYVVALRAAYADLLRSRGIEAAQADALGETMFRDMVTFIGFGEWGKDEARAAAEHARGGPHRLLLSEVTLRAPLRPVALRDCIAFETHLKNFYENINRKEIPPAFYEIPVYYKGNPSTVVGPDEDVPWPHYSQEWDYELELGVVIGPSAHNVTKDEAESHIYGLTCFNDFSARDVLRKEISIGLGPAKAKDFATGIGPWLVTRDEIDNLYDLEMVARVNGEEWSRGNSGQIHWGFADIITRMADSEPLRAGEIFGSGTVAFGCGLELGKYLEHGDVVELEITGLGVLRNRVVNGS